MQSFDLNIEKYDMNDIREIFELEYPYTIDIVQLKRKQLIDRISNEMIDNKSEIIVFIDELSKKCMDELENEKRSMNTRFDSMSMPIENKNTSEYVLKKKLVSIHTDDRNKTSYPNQSEFEIVLPMSIQNVVKVELNEINIPVYNDTILNEYENTKFIFEIHEPVEPKIGGNGAVGRPVPDWTSTINWDPAAGTDPRRLEIENVIYKVLLDLANVNHKFLVEINEGYYGRPQMLVTEIMRQMNYVVENTIKLSPIYIAWENARFPNPPGITNYIDTVIYERFHLNYNELSHKIEIYNQGDNFRLLFNEDISYSIDETRHSINRNVIFKNHKRDGLTDYLGFKKEIYTASYKDVLISEPYPFRQKYFWNQLDTGPTTDGSFNKIYYVNANYKLKYWLYNTVYMEFDGLNSIDELEPNMIEVNQDMDPLMCTDTKWRNLNKLKKVYGSGLAKDGLNCPENTDNTDINYHRVDPKALRKQIHDVRGNGRENSIFAKIPLITSMVSSLNYVNKNDSLFNEMVYQPPIEEIKKCKFRFRYHNGYLVNFSNNDFDFTLQFTYLDKSIQNNNYHVEKSYQLL